jgi:hypothetical protein
MRSRPASFPVSTMPLVFHQNMRVFGGGAPRRTAALNAINVATGPWYIAAGFTEISNPNAPLHGALAGLAQTLDPGLTRLLVSRWAARRWGCASTWGLRGTRAC